MNDDSFLENGKNRIGGLSDWDDLSDMIAPDILSKLKNNQRFYTITRLEHSPVYVMAHKDYFTADRSVLIKAQKDPKVFVQLMDGNYVLLAEWP